MKTKILTFLLVLGCCGFSFAGGCPDCPVIDFGGSPFFFSGSPLCAGDDLTICVDTQTAAAIDGDCTVTVDLVTNMGPMSFSSSFSGSEICFDIPLSENPDSPCNTYAFTPTNASFSVSCDSGACAAGTPGIIGQPGPPDNCTGSVSVVAGGRTVFPTFTENIVMPTCAGEAGIAQLLASESNTVCEEFVGTAGASNECPATSSTNAELEYNFAGSGGQCYPAPGSGNISIDCSVSCVCTPAVATVTAGAAVVGSESVCSQEDGVTLEGGLIEAPTTACPDGSTLEYSTDGGMTWSATLPVYDQMNAITVETRCICDLNPDDISMTASVTTVPGECVPPECMIQAEIVMTACDDQGNTDPFDDIITFTVAITDNGGGSSTGWTDDQATPQSGTYGSVATYMVLATNSVSIVYTDADDMDCTAAITLTANPCATSDPVPTVGEWGLIMLGLLMLIAAVVGIRQRREEEAYG